MISPAGVRAGGPHIHLPSFDGPLGLLLALIEQRRLEVTEISLAVVADQYLEAVRRLPDPAPDLLAEFLGIASRLLLIKSRALLPRLALEADGDDPVIELRDRILEYRLIRAAAEQLQRIEGQGISAFPAAPRAGIAIPIPLRQVSTVELRELACAVLARRSMSEPLVEAAGVERTGVEARARLIMSSLAKRGRIGWDTVAGDTRDQVVASFLAVLELFKCNQVLLQQALPAGPLWLVARLDGRAVAMKGGTARRESQES